jgi:hypothetical protein
MGRERYTTVLLLEQLVTNVLGPNMIPVNSVGGFDSTSHLRRQCNRLLKHQKIGRRVLIFYLGDYDPSGLEIQKDLERRMKNWGLTNFEIRSMLWHG